MAKKYQDYDIGTKVNHVDDGPKEKPMRVVDAWKVPGGYLHAMSNDQGPYFGHELKLAKEPKSSKGYKNLHDKASRRK